MGLKSDTYSTVMCAISYFIEPFYNDNQQYIQLMWSINNDINAFHMLALNPMKISA